MDDIVDVLQVFGELANWTQCPASEVGDPSCPPIVAWRYKHSRREIAEFFQQAIESYRGAISWRFSAAEKMWTLMPCRIHELSSAQPDLGGLGAAEQLMKSEPDFGKRANKDLPLLTEYIRLQLKDVKAAG